MIDRNIAPQIKDAVTFDLHLQPLQTHTLSNNIPVYTVHSANEEVMMIEWVFDAGNWVEQKQLQAGITSALLKSGTSSKSAFIINELIEFYGAHLSVTCYAETAVIALHSLSKYVPTLLPIVKEIIVDAVFPEEEIKIAVDDMKQKLQVNLQKSSFVAGRLIDVYLFGEEHPYGKYSKAEDFDKVSRKDLVDFYEKFYKNGSVKIFAAGNLPHSLQDDLQKLFGDLQNNPTEIIHHNILPASQKKYSVVNDVKSKQASIRIARPFYNRHHPDFLKSQLLNLIFGGYFGSRLMTNIREDKGYTYGIHSYILSHKHENAWLITTEAGKDVAAKTIEEVYKEMNLLKSEKISDDELLLVKNYMIGSIMGNIDGSFQILGRWKSIILNNLPMNFFDQQIETFKTTSAEELQALAKTYFNEDDFYELVVY